MKFNWTGSSSNLQGIRDTHNTEVSSGQLKRMQDTKSISEFYHLEMKPTSLPSLPDFSVGPSNIQSIDH